MEISNGSYRQYSGRLAGLAGPAQVDPQPTIGFLKRDDGPCPECDFKLGVGGRKPERITGLVQRPRASITYRPAAACVGARDRGRDAAEQPIGGQCDGTAWASQVVMTPATCRLFFSSMTMWALPWMP